MQLNCGLSVWQKPKDFFYQICSFLWKGHNKRFWGQTINKTMTNQSHTEPKRTKTVILNCGHCPRSTILTVKSSFHIYPLQSEEEIVALFMKIDSSSVGQIGWVSINVPLYLYQRLIEGLKYVDIH